MAIHRDSLLDPHHNFGPNSELDKTMSAMGGTQLGTSFRNSKQIMVKNNQSRNRLPQIALKDQSGFLYTTREDQKLMQTYMHNN